MFLYARDEIHSHAAPNLRAELKMELRGCVWFESAVMTGLERQQQRGAPWKFIPSLPAARQYSPPRLSVPSDAVPSAVMALT